ncbi:PP2C family protein-serine/threonine phosphatase [Kibdelosporangium phytohabitans]|uniref:Diguanylate phosphodiesterase n=1 Tax=Kibdelosporangium phytohabitans TaxID=860235 RepID=A0A0N9I3S5_9PSEU|nr:GAF domain-containing SpoIIE family protein phosphatase [Kibdelosporangium phytohabitans]ALG10563.1 diguanylate phosphodiesterase [Kibdelosporangium phytohabitans]MBE1461667.1 serine phosphatase RsbU (regulator of sigma subunit) [Kibdelosporangium phytohabitans]
MTEESSAEDLLRRIESVTDSALSHLGLEKLLEELLARVREHLSVDTATVLLHDNASGQLIATASAGFDEEIRQGVRLPVGTGFAGRVAAERKPITIDHVDASTVVNPLLWEKGLHAMLGVPMVAGSQLVGVVHVGSFVHRQFTARDIRLLELAADRMALATQAQVVRTERATATALQRSLLPGRLPRPAGLEFAARYVPGADVRVGGDWYDVFELPGERWGIVMGDVVGHGLPAAVVMGRLRSALRAYALLDIDDPAEVLDKLNRKAVHFEAGIMATVLYAVVDPAFDRIRISLAGHPPPVLAVAGEPTRLLELVPDPPIGVRYDLRRRDAVVTFPPEAVMAFFTDGLVERRGWTLNTGLAMLGETITAGPAEAVTAKAMSVLTQAVPPEDDVALLVMRRLRAGK